MLALMNADELQKQVDYIKDEVRRCEVRWTSQRQIIVERFIQFKGHHTVEAFYEEVRKDDDSISMATVYRSFNLLVDIGVAVKRVFDEGPATFEYILNRDHHDHLIDVDSGDIIEFVDEEIEILQKMVAKQLGFELEDHRMVLYGKRLD